MSKAPPKIKLNREFYPLYKSDKRYFILTGGRGSLKTSTVQDFVVRLTFEKGHGVLYTRYTMDSAQKSIIPEFTMTLERMGLRHLFHVTNKKVINKKTGSFIYFSGIKTSSGDQTATLKGIAGVTTWIIEEGEDFKDEKAFDDIDDSIRTSKHQNRVIWIQNPTTREHFIYKKFITKTNKQISCHGYNVTVSAHPEVEHIHTTYHVAEQLGYLNKSWLRKANNLRKKAEARHLIFEATNGEDGQDKQESQYYYTYIGGWLERAEGAIFKNWKEGVFNPSNLPTCVPLDWGYSPDPLAVSRMAVDKKAKLIYVDELIYETEVDHVAKKLGSVGVGRRELIVCDTNEPRTKNAVKKAGYNITNAVKDRIVDDIREIKKYTIIVSPRSANYKTEFNNYEWNDKKASIPIDEFNHLIDGMRYGFNRLTRGRKKVSRRN